MPLIDLVTPELETEEVERAREISDRWLLYEGDHPQSVLPVTLKQGEEVDDNVTINYCGLFVDKGVSFLFGQEVGFVLGTEEVEQLDAEDEAAVEAARVAREQEEQQVRLEEEALEGVWTGNKKMAFLQKLAMNGGVAGHAGVKIVDRGSSQVPRLINLDPTTLSVIFDEDDFERVLGYKLQWRTSLGVRRQLIEPAKDLDPEGSDSWIVTDFFSRSNPEMTVPGKWEQTGVARWEHPFPPIADCQNLPNPNVYYGYSDVEKVQDLNVVVNRAASHLQKAVRIHGAPRPWTAGVTAEQIGIVESRTERIVTLPEKASLNNLEMGGEALAPSLSFYEILRDSMHEQGKVPKIAMGRLDSGAPTSGVALAILYQPILELTETKRSLYGELITEVSRRLLVMASSRRSVAIAWPSVLPADEKAEAEIAVIDQTLGASKRTLLEKRGYDPEIEEERSAEEDSGAPAVDQVADALDAVEEDQGLNAA